MSPSRSVLCLIESSTRYFHQIKDTVRRRSRSLSVPIVNAYFVISSRLVVVRKLYKELNVHMAFTKSSKSTGHLQRVHCPQGLLLRVQCQQDIYREFNVHMTCLCKEFSVHMTFTKSSMSKGPFFFFFYKEFNLQTTFTMFTGPLRRVRCLQEINKEFHAHS